MAGSGQQETGTQDLPLQGVRVLDLSRFIAGPMCGMLLGDMGADVIKVEKPGGEDTRSVAPFWQGESVYAMTYNRNKRAMTVNTRSEEGRKILHELVDWADVVVENFRAGTLEAMGIGYEALRARKPGIIVTSVSGYGQYGPLRDRALFDCIAQAASGLMYRNGEGEQAPQLTGMFVADHLAGLYAAFGTSLAMLQRRVSGQGQHVDIALFDCLLSCLGPALSSYLMLGAVMPRLGNRDAFAAPANVFRASDGYIYLHAGTDALFRRFCEFIGRPELMKDDRFRTVAGRLERVHEVEELVAEWVGDRSAEDCERLLAEAGLPVAAVADVAQALANPQVAEREMVLRIATGAGELRLPGNPVKLSATAAEAHRPPPSVGEHTSEILRSLLGYSDAMIDRLRSREVI